MIQHGYHSPAQPTKSPLCALPSLPHYTLRHKRAIANQFIRGLASSFTCCLLSTMGGAGLIGRSRLLSTRKRVSCAF